MRDDWTERLNRGIHAIHTYKSEIEQNRVLVDVIEWLANDEMLVYLTDKWHSAQEKRLTDDQRRTVKSALECGRLEFEPSFSSYCPGGEFKGLPMMIEMLRQTHRDTTQKGFKGAVLMGDESWLPANPSVFGAFLRYERGIDLTGLPNSVTILCQYDKRLFARDQLLQATSAHQLELTGGRLTRNYWLVSRSSLSSDSSHRSASGEGVLTGALRTV